MASDRDSTPPAAPLPLTAPLTAEELGREYNAAATPPHGFSEIELSHARVVRHAAGLRAIAAYVGWRLVERIVSYTPCPACGCDGTGMKSHANSCGLMVMLGAVCAKGEGHDG